MKVTGKKTGKLSFKINQGNHSYTLDALESAGGEGLEISAETELTDEDPKVFKEIILSYHITGNSNDAKKIKKAASLSMETYCGVSAMLEKNSRIFPEFYLNKEKI
jgi:uncharacterized OsmC-like protein